MYRGFSEVMAFSKGNRTVFDQILLKLRDRNVVPFVGAGLTCFAYPGWGKALTTIAEKYVDDMETESKVKGQIKAEQLIEAAQTLETALGRVNFADYVAELFRRSKLNDHENTIHDQAVYLLPELFDGLVITTNFDETIEHVYTLRGKSFESRIILPGRTEALNRFLRGEGGGLFKVHGTMLGERIEYERIIFTEESYKAAYGSDTALKNNLKKCFEQKVLLFLGCSLARDMTVDLLKNEVLAPGVENYAIINCPAGEQQKKRQELDKLNIKAILYDPDLGGRGQGHNAVTLVLEQLLAELDPMRYRLFREQYRKPTGYTNQFMYNSGSTEFTGRGEEMDRLGRFMNTRDDCKFRWWGMIGPGGSGKSRIAWELGKEYSAKGWKVVYLQRENYDRLDEVYRDCARDTLIIADYVQQYAQKLGNWMDALTQRPRGCELRLLLIERDSAGDWEQQIYNQGDYTRLNGCRFESGFIKLKKLEEDQIRDIITSFAKHLNDTDNTTVPLKGGDEDTIIKALSKVDKKLVRPLYALFITDAVVHGEQPASWKKERVLDYVVTREKKRIRENVRGLYNRLEEDEELEDALTRLWLIATVLQDLTLEKVKEICPDIWEILQDRRKARRLVDVHDLLRRVELLDGEKIPAMRPDLMGEYFVLNGLITAKPEKALEIYNAVLSRQDDAGGFFKMAVGDHHVYINEENGAHWFSIVPDNIVKTTHPLAAANLIGRVYEWCGNNAQRQRLIGIMAQCAEGVHDETAETATAYMNVGYAYSQSDYDKALEWYTKAKDAKEAVLGKNHPSTATSYNNIGGVYNSKGEYDMALEWFTRAKDIREKVLGEYHPDTATSYNNIGGVYYRKGDYDMALEWYTKAKDAKEAVLGKNHPSTATSYNNIGGVYLAKGDYKNALIWTEKALNIYERVLGSEHPRTNESRENVEFVRRRLSPQ